MERVPFPDASGYPPHSGFASCLRTCPEAVFWTCPFSLAAGLGIASRSAGRQGWSNSGEFSCARRIPQERFDLVDDYVLLRTGSLAILKPRHQRSDVR